MQVQASPGMLNQLRRSRGSSQRTFKTPLDQIAPFATTLLAGQPPITSAALTIEAIVFTPKHLQGLLSDRNLPLDLRGDWTITADGKDEAHALLEAALGDWVDFYFAPQPNGFLLYADHDEYTTVFAAGPGPLVEFAAAMTAAGFAEVSGYSRVV